MNEGSYGALRAWRLVSLFCVIQRRDFNLEKSLISITIWVKSNSLSMYYVKNIQLLLGEPIFMPYIYNLLLNTYWIWVEMPGQLTLPF
jgi:hypothetical protein